MWFTTVKACEWAEPELHKLPLNFPCPPHQRKFQTSCLLLKRFLIFLQQFLYHGDVASEPATVVTVIEWLPKIPTSEGFETLRINET